MTLTELITKIRVESPAVAGNVDDRAIQRLLRTAFAIVAREVAAAPDGAYKLSGLGNFRVRTVEPKGEKSGGRRVLFKAASPKKDRKAKKTPQ
jgi:hypothetical protein